MTRVTCPNDRMSDYRYEIKIRLTPEALPRLEQWLALHPAGFRTAFPDRWINNIYFDTPDLQAFQDNLRGIARRQKTRLRWYGDTRRPDRVVLEIKNKAGELGWKDRSEIRFRPDGPLEVMGRPELTRRLADQASPLTALVLTGQTPSLINRYRRRYLENTARTVRLTVDDRLCFGLPGEARCLTPSGLLTRHQAAVVEIKFGQADAAAGRAVLNSLPFRRTKFSKYVVGLQTVAL